MKKLQFIIMKILDFPFPDFIEEALAYAFSTSKIFFLLKNSKKCGIYHRVIQRNNKLKAAIILLTGLYLFLSAFPLAAGELPFKNISAEELLQLQGGESVFRILDRYKDFSLQTEDAESEKIRKILKEVKPNFLAEILMVIPVDKDRDNLDFIRTTLMDITLFDDIPYYSKRNKKWYPLYEDTEILSQTFSARGKNTILAYHKMKPFKPQETMYKYLIQGNTFSFESRNSSDIYYKNFKSVKKGKLVTLLWVKDEGDRLIVYGIGGASAFTFFGLFGERMDDSFIGRMKAFFSWFYDNYITAIMEKS